MTLYASFGDSRAVALRLTESAWGRWTADIRLAEDDALPDTPLPLVVGNKTLLGRATVGGNGTFAGTRSVRIVGGFGGWGKDVAARWYVLASGVRLAAVLRDAAAEVGESIVVSAANDRSVGPFFTRAKGPGSRVLSALVGREGWYIDALGVTQIGERPATPITSDFDLPASGFLPNLGRLTVATEDLFSWQPGAIFTHELLEDAMQVSSVTTLLEASGKLRLEVLAA